MSAAVDWPAEVAAMCAGEAWPQVLAGLAATRGGASVAAVLRRAALAATQHAGEAGGAAGLAAAVQQVAWEKLHSGDWHAASPAWRDAYTAACILAAAAGLPSGGEPEARAAAGGDPSLPAEAAGMASRPPLPAAAAEAAAVSAALRHLDLAAIMGGPLLRLAVDGLIDSLQRRWQQLSEPASGPAAAAADLQAAVQRRGGAGDRPAKRARADAAAAPEQAVEAAAAAAQAAEPALPPWSLGPRGVPVASALLPSLETFWRDHLSTSTPVVISGAMEDWPALQRWGDPAYLVAVAGPRTVPVEVGDHYLAEAWGQQLMTLQSFVRRHIQSGGGGRGAGVPPPRQAGEAGEGVAGPTGGQQREQVPQPAQQQPEGQRAQRGYLAQHPLFDQIPALAGDIREPPYCCLGEGEVQAVNAWFGPAGTVTPLHTDPHHNLLCQAAGRKYVRLYSPAHSAAMYPHSQGLHTNSGRVDVGLPDLARFPLFGKAPFQDCVLEAGQMLFIPAGWWHYVQSASVSFSVSYWWR